MVAVSAPPQRAESFRGSGLAVVRAHSAPGAFAHEAEQHGDSTGAIEPQDITDIPAGPGGKEHGIGTQGFIATFSSFTKVFRMRSATLGVQRRPNIEQASTLLSNGQHAGSPPSTRQVMRHLVRPNATLVLLPDPVTCFAGARYTQVQRFDLRCADTSSLVMLDWFTPGRVYLATGSAHSTANAHGTASASNPNVESLPAKRSELWAFDSYRSRNELRVAGRLFARDVMLLEQSSLTQLSQGGQPTRGAAPGLRHFLDAMNGGPAHQRLGTNTRNDATVPLSVRCHPYTTYVTLLLVGPDCEQAIHHLKAAFAKIEQGVLPASKQPDDLIWSLSELHCEPQQSDLGKRSPLRGAIVRVAGKETQTVRAWLAKHLQSMVDVVGPDLYRQALGEVDDDAANR
ncbi:Urease accessory protein UreD [Ceraceosorus bombacis]|uniref:Urease accessory protein UreD n=1 Tax=Ceraceosorus bombacis TaxID=401625 RepID=A0A0P1BMM6_9BASI|nr:Urease accessory protein UreD [Ceraceosorus bombacis]